MGNSSHVLRIRNQLDSMYNAAGQMNVDSLIVTVQSRCFVFPEMINLSHYTIETENIPSHSPSVPVHSNTSNTGLKVAFAIAVIEAIMIIGLLAFILLKSRRRRKKSFPGPSEEQQSEPQPSTPLIILQRASMSNSADYDPYEEMENPSDMPTISRSPRARLQRNTSGVSSGMSLEHSVYIY
jgi:hypothetical protein